MCRAAIGAHFFPLSSGPAPSPPRPPCSCGHSVLQDDLHKARHVGFFGLVGGEEGMLLKRTEGKTDRERVLQLHRALWCSLMAVTEASTVFFFSFI